MDPSSSSASFSTAPPEPPRPQAGPLPRKRGEIGYSDNLARESEEGRSESPTVPLPARHPEDRRPQESATPADSNLAAASTPSLATTTSTTSTSSVAKKKCTLGFLKSKKIPSYGGLRLTTLLAFTIQVLAIAATIVGWYFTITRINQAGKSSSNNNSVNTEMLGNASTAIFIHVVFAVVTLVQLLFLERRVFRLRAERYSYLHPGEILPSARRREMGDPSISFSPWNRPPLPTYAAALAQSGAGTGDVEDHLIAAPPPPAYGNTRGSTFLLSGYLRDSLRAQRPVSQQTQASQNNLDRPMSERRERPLSYKSVDEDWEEIQDAERARRLEETLSTLERPTTRR